MYIFAIKNNQYRNPILDNQSTI